MHIGYEAKLTFQISSSEYSSRGSKLFLIVPPNIVGSCGIMLNLDLRSWRPIVENRDVDSINDNIAFCWLHNVKKGLNKSIFSTLCSPYNSHFHPSRETACKAFQDKGKMWPIMHMIVWIKFID